MKYFLHKNCYMVSPYSLMTWARAYFAQLFMQACFMSSRRVIVRNFTVLSATVATFETELVWFLQ